MLVCPGLWGVGGLHDADDFKQRLWIVGDLQNPIAGVSERFEGFEVQTAESVEVGQWLEAAWSEQEGGFLVSDFFGVDTLC